MFELFRKGIGKGMKIVAEIIFALIIIELLSLVMGGTNVSFLMAVAIVAGSYVGLRFYKKQHHKGKFGENLRGSEIEDRTDTDQP